MFQFGLYRVLIFQLGVLLGFYEFNVHKYNFGNTADKVGGGGGGGEGPQVGNHWPRGLTLYLLASSSVDVLGTSGFAKAISMIM